ncbi:hypothetical protein T459_26905 [Capsicum annuum]|uniref:Disease resistance protein winged helix domain-containing protein n=1 Tax=Capsicum annuum TaxID=4072 RepID=A0A2G2YCE2_CAPAN|nr:hypothetical protein T459_26905 [Capsicum annuum]
MSYDRLPQEVQTCFLYCGVFPRGFDIPSWKLIRMWIVEGLTKPQQTYALEEIDELHLNDLAKRNYLILMQKRSNGQIKACRLHDKLHEFCRKEATNKWLFHEICKTPDNVISSIQDQDTRHRLCIEPSILYDFLATRPLQNMTLTNYFILRYIAISGDFKVLSPTFGTFWNLQTLILNTSTSEPTIDVKEEIWNMLELRHLHTNIPAKLPSLTTTTLKASCLQTLSMVSPESCKKDVLAKACNLKKLSIRGQMVAFLETRGGISNLEELKFMEHLKLLNDALYMNKLLHLPPEFFRLVRTVKKLTFANTKFPWSEADRLGQLESLEVLKLKENAFMGDTWRPEVGGFSQLQILWIERAELETWEASNLCFPILRHLVLVSCDKLNAVPLELADIPNLHEMQLDNTSKAVKSAKDILNVRHPKT